MNHEPRPEKQKSFWLELGGKRINCTPENTDAYLYEDQTFDHIFHTINHDQHGNRNGFYIFRPMLGDEAFDNLVRHMINNGFGVESLCEPDPNDKQVYINKYGEPCKPELIKPVELTPRQEKFVENYGKFLQVIDVTVEDFR
jgi:hypothetical protein